MNKVVIFDWGGVCESHENNLKELQDAKVRVFKRLNNNLKEEQILDKFVYRTSNNESLGITNNQEDIEDWVNYVQKLMNINVTFAEFKKIYEEEFAKITYYKDVVKYVHSLKGRCKIGILSNLTPFDKKRIDDQYDLSKFDYVYLSFELGLRKPDRDIYEYVLNDINTKPENILFVDDEENNIKMAKKCGWNTCKAYGYELDKIKQSVENFLKQ